MRPWVLAAVGACGGLVAAAAFASWSACACDKPPLDAEAVRMLAGASFMGVGLVALVEHRRRLAALMEAVGASWFLYEVGYVYWSLPYTIGRVTGGLWQPVLAHLVVAFPDGRLRSRLDRIIVVSGYASYIALSLATSAFWDPRDAGCPDVCPPNLLQVHRDAHIADVIQTASQVAVIVLALAALTAVLRHLRMASVAGRRALSPVVWASAPLVALVVGYDLVGIRQFPWLGPLALMALPIAFLIGLLRMHLTRADLGRLVVRLEGRPPPAELQQALAHTLHDPTLQLLFHLTGTGSFVDSTGAPVELPGEDSGRVTTILERDGQPIAALVHDPALMQDPELIEAAAATARLTLENERLRDEIRAQLDEVLASRARIASATEAERRRLERDLHDGAQQRLVTLLLSLRMTQFRLGGADPQLATALSAAADEAWRALAELREFAHGLHPAILTEAGLLPAIESLAHRCAVPTTVVGEVRERPPPAVEAALYFAVSESLANAAKHARASRASVTLEERDGWIHAEVVDDGIGGADSGRGTGLVGLMDRLAAVGGTLEVFSPASVGTRIVVSVPSGRQAAALPVT